MSAVYIGVVARSLENGSICLGNPFEMQVTTILSRWISAIESAAHRTSVGCRSSKASETYPHQLSFVYQIRTSKMHYNANSEAHRLALLCHLQMRCKHIMRAFSTPVMTKIILGTLSRLIRQRISYLSVLVPVPNRIKRVIVIEGRPDLSKLSDLFE